MADNKYGRVFTEGDVDKIFEWLVDQGEGQPLNLEQTLEQMDEDGVRFKFEEDEPIFVLRGHDKRAVGAIKHYLDHQGPRAPENHINGIMAALRSFDSYRQENPGKIKEPD